MKKIVVGMIVFLLSVSSCFAVDAQVESVFENFLSSLGSKYTPSQQEVVLLGLRQKLDVFSRDSKYADLKDVLSDLNALNNEALYETWLEKELGMTSQLIVELKERKSLTPVVSADSLPNYIKNILTSQREYIPTNSHREFVKGGDILRVIYSKYYLIENNNASNFSSKTGIIIFDEESQEYRFIDDYSFEKKLPYSQMSQKFKAYLTQNHKIKAISGDYYAYNFIHYKFYDDVYGAYNSQLEASGFDFDTTLFYRHEDGSYNFVKDYTRYKLTSEDMVFGVPEKHLFLDYLREDSKYQSENISSELSKIKNISSSLTQGVSKEQGIENIYNWILENIQYSQNFDLSDEKIFSGIETFKNNQGVCTGYTKLSSYLFYFAGYYDIEVIRGHVIDAADFPKVGHAWLRIGDKYYDPTFDDPVGNKETRSPKNYMYYALPKDIFYANRFEYGNLPESIKTASQGEIKQFIFNSLSSLESKYKDSIDQYPVFTPVIFRKTHNISPTTTITPEILAEKIGSFTVKDDSFTFQKNGKTKHISEIRYYAINDTNTETALAALSYNTDTLTLFHWETDSGIYQWRLAYELSY